MGARIRDLFVMVSVAAGAVPACNGEPTIVEPPPPSFACEPVRPIGEELPSSMRVARPDSLVRLTRSFGDSPLEGTVVVEPRDSGEWVIDLNADGAPEAIGEMKDGAEVPYRYTSVGAHEIRVRFRNQGEEQEIALPAVVNDPAATVVEELAVGLTMGGITITPDGHEIWSGAIQPNEVLRFAASNFDVRDRIPVVAPELGLAEGWTATPDGSRVLYVSKKGVVYIFGHQDPREDQRAIRVRNMLPSFFIQALSPTQVLIGSVDGIALLNIDTCQFDQVVKVKGAWPFTVDSDAGTVAVIEDPDQESWGVIILSLPDLEVLRRFSVSSTSVPKAIAFGPNSEDLFILVRGFGEIPDELFVMDSRSGEISVVHVLPAAQHTVSDGSGKTATLSQDGRFVVVPSGTGAYFVEADREIPLYRTDPIACCEVVVSPIDESLFFFSGFERLSRVRLTR